MGFFGRMIRNGISEGIEKAVGNAVSKVVEPKATALANKAAEHLEDATENATKQAKATTSGWESAMANLERAAQGYATEAAKNMKVCPNCEQPTTSDKKFCPHCGTKLPEKSVAEGSVCTNCGKQNAIGTKFCQDCGTKLPAAIEEEQAAANRDAAVLAEWDMKLADYPKWNCGGNQLDLEQMDTDVYRFGASYDGNHVAAKEALRAYTEELKKNGFTAAGQYPSESQLYKMVNGNCYHVDLEHCFDGDPDRVTLGFDIGEPTGGFHYVKPEPKAKIGLKDLKGLFGR